MRFTRLLCILLASTFAFSLMAKKPKDKNNYGVYLAGVSASFTDSLVYFTDIQFVDSAAVDGKSFLIERAQYSEQLKEYLSQHEGTSDRTCFVLYNKKKTKLTKELHKLKEKYAKNEGIILKDVDTSFKFLKATNF